MPPPFLHMFRIEFANQISTDGIGLAKQSIFSVYGSPVATDTGFSIFCLESDASRAPPLFWIERSDLGRYGVNGNSISAQFTDRRLHESVFILATYTIFLSTITHTCYIIFRHIFQWTAAQSDS